MKTVTESALIARINRKLAHDGWERVRVAREGSRMESECGRHYIVDINHNAVRDKFVNLENLGRELGVLGGAEVLA